jgi:type I restriction enzyme, S subunit
MIDGLKPYPAYKDSGVEWLGRVPEHWEVQRLKRICRFAYGDSMPAGSRSQGLVPVFGSNGRVGFHSQPNANGPCLVIGRKGSFGKVNFSREPVFAIDTTFFVDDRFTLSAIRWLYHVLNWLQLDRISKDSAVPGLDREDAYSRVLAASRTSSEQSAIARFLDHADLRIQRYIRAKQKLIKLLKEQKQAIIHRAVTHGLDPNVRLKPSGVDWLGDMPEHWEVRRNGRVFAQRQETGFPDLPILEVSLRTGVRVRSFDASDRKQVMFDRSQYKRAVAGDIAYNMMRMWQGAVGVAPVDGLVSPAYVVAKPLEGTEPRYFHRLFRTIEYMREIDAFSRGIVKDRNRLYWEDFKQMSSPYPPAAEQIQIADAVEEEARATEIAITTVQNEIDLLREYRARIISDVVTGKLDVREAAAKLPDELFVEPEESIDEIAEAEAEDLEAAVEEEVEA